MMKGWRKPKKVAESEQSKDGARRGCGGQNDEERGWVEEGRPARSRPFAMNTDSQSPQLHPLLSSSHSLSPAALVAVDARPISAGGDPSSPILGHTFSFA
ncbi:hypothetical protein BLNAU_14197 [Blattamonas nauphoetae]|uniref:Uncharacterized protein n=1 Tax=Blattamonas nauphoetae TaxID=2049346 RepID=A0ABQ9XI69_9EUKA|nr:hypothetical protein BLNAU_14197 [Blattamonas nauphoetae]